MMRAVRYRMIFQTAPSIWNKSLKGQKITYPKAVSCEYNDREDTW